MIYTIGMILSFLGGALCMWMIYEADNAPVYQRWHSIGHTSQFTYKGDHKTLDSKDMEIEIFEN